jgi:hypothetical protein
MRRVYFTRISAQLGFVTGIKQQLLPQTTSHQPRENDYFSGPIGNFGNRNQNKARYCEINIEDFYHGFSYPPLLDLENN